jgi:hypothetical protein
MIHLAECVHCGEFRYGTLRDVQGEILCFNCSDYADTHTRALCLLCGRIRPCEMHHVYGRRNDPLTVPLCCNCHRWDKGLMIIRWMNDIAQSLPMDNIVAVFLTFVSFFLVCRMIHRFLPVYTCEGTH